jgi:hypothetical protein
MCDERNVWLPDVARQGAEPCSALTGLGDGGGALFQGVALGSDVLGPFGPLSASRARNIRAKGNALEPHEQQPGGNRAKPEGLKHRNEATPSTRTSASPVAIVPSPKG